jgi:hypothetical protein
VVFIATGGLLPADTYTVTLRSAANGFKDLAFGQLLDGDSNGTAGGDYVTTFANPPQQVVVSLPDFTRGPGQAVDVPPVEVIEVPDDDVTPGLPVRLSDADGIQSVVLTVTYDPGLLEITAASPGPDVPTISTVLADFADVGDFRQLTLTFSSPTPLEAGSAEFITLTAGVPLSAPSGAAHILDIEILDVNSGAISATADDAIHTVGFFGDATGDGTYSGLDAQRVARVTVGLDGGFRAYPTIDPLIVGDITRDGGFSGLDAQRIAQMTVGLDPVEIPPLPGETQPLIRVRAANQNAAGDVKSDLSRVRSAHRPPVSGVDADSGARSAPYDQMSNLGAQGAPYDWISDFRARSAPYDVPPDMQLKASMTDAVRSGTRQLFGEEVTHWVLDEPLGSLFDQNDLDPATIDEAFALVGG